MQKLRWIGLILGLLIAASALIWAAENATVQDLWDMTLNEGYVKRNVRIVTTWETSNLTKIAAIPTSATVGDYVWTLAYSYDGSDLIGWKVAKTVVDATQITDRDAI